jgi:uncharacterized membrane protein
VQAFLTKTFTVGDKEFGIVQIYTAPNPIGGILVVVPVADIHLCKTPLPEAVEYSISLGTVMSENLIADFSEVLVK